MGKTGGLGCLGGSCLTLFGDELPTTNPIPPRDLDSVRGEGVDISESILNEGLSTEGTSGGLGIGRGDDLAVVAFLALLRALLTSWLTSSSVISRSPCDSVAIL